MGRRGYPPEFRRKVLALVEAGRPIAEVAKALGSAPSPSSPGGARTASTRVAARPEQPGEGAGCHAPCHLDVVSLLWGWSGRIGGPDDPC